MFGGFAPPQQSQEEIRALEADAAFTVQGAITTAVLLYLCTFGDFSCSKKSGANDVPQLPSLSTSLGRSSKYQ
ncbi:unnamed protein product [Fusarium fujikuroi]|uniref:Uncharacterized protein n=1 Tax=Fusarium fujikuroi TaxID=5127 RepID=A0A9Q9UC38_FUSFU|nr:unnamed protein product [Fusarium fujikuroi]VTT72878.1 unnamed protein product [Fusarium fujikuroi]VZH96429.1 unnamed protein product [Fusarium fujikuroi]